MSDRMTRALTALLAMAPIAQQAYAQEHRDADFRVSDIEARLLYEQTGTLSVDLSDHPEFAAWNTIIGAGSALENANDLLVSAVIEGPGQHNLETPLVITVRDADGKTIATRTVAGMLTETKTVRSIILYDVGCAGLLSLEARLGRSMRAVEIWLRCGE